MIWLRLEKNGASQVVNEQKSEENCPKEVVDKIIQETRALSQIL